MSPLVVDGKVMIGTGGGDGGANGIIAAFDTATGKTRWRTDRRATVGWGTPIVLRAGGRDELRAHVVAEVAPGLTRYGEWLTRALIERSRSDLTTTVIQERLRRSLEEAGS